MQHVVVIMAVHVDREHVLAVGEGLVGPILVLRPVNTYVRRHSILLLPFSKDVVISSGRVKTLQQSLGRDNSFLVKSRLEPHSANIVVCIKKFGLSDVSLSELPSNQIVLTLS